MDMDRFRSNVARGNFSEEPDGYDAWAAWANQIRRDLMVVERRHAHLSSGVSPRMLDSLVALCAENSESAIHVLANDMLAGGASWSHLAMLRRVSAQVDAGFPEMDDIAGQFLPQVVRALAWYGRLDEGPGMEGGLRRCTAAGIRDDEMTIEASPDGSVRVSLFEGNGEGAATLLCKGDAQKLLRTLRSTLSSRERDRVPVFIGTGAGETRQGVVVVPSNMGEPYRETLRVSLVGGHWASLASMEAETWVLEQFVRGMERILGPEPPVAPTRSPR